MAMWSSSVQAGLHDQNRLISLLDLLADRANRRRKRRKKGCFGLGGLGTGLAPPAFCGLGRHTGADGLGQGMRNISAVRCRLRVLLDPDEAVHIGERDGRAAGRVDDCRVVVVGDRAAW